MNKILVSYFSASGVTKKVALNIADFIGADLYEITPLDRYTSADLDWTDKQSRSSAEMSDDDCRPSIKDINFSIDNYDIILLGFPIWWEAAPRVINTFLESVDLSNKKIILFCTSGGSGIEHATEDLKRKYPNYNFIGARRLNTLVDRSDIKDWLT